METNTYQILQDWHELLKTGVITDAEFTVKKNELLGEQKKEEALLSNQDIRILTKEEQAHIDSEYEILFNNKSWIQKSKNWFIGLSIVIALGSLFWYVTSNNYKKTNSSLTQSTEIENMLTDFILKEQHRNYRDIENYYSDIVERYWDLQHPSKQQIQKRYEHFWNITLSSENQLIEIVKIDDLTYDVVSDFKYVGRKTQKTTVLQNTRTRFIFDDFKKIISTYGIE